jgi:hypothetical protein
MADQIAIQVTGIPAAEAEEARQGLELEPEESLENFGILEGIVLIGAGIAAGKFIIRLWREFKGGTIIDLTKKPPDVRRDHDLDYGYFIIIAEDGQVTLEAKDEPKDAMERMVPEVLKVAADATVEGVKAVIEKAIPNPKVTTDPATG